jgi:hypothetical protein
MTTHQTMNSNRELAEATFIQGIETAIKKANETGFVAPFRFTALADLIQIQCLRINDPNLLEFTLPEGLYDTVKDLANHTKSNITLFNTKEPDKFIVEFSSKDDQDKFIETFEMMRSQGQRAFPALNLYQGKEDIDGQFCLDAISFLFSVVQDLEKQGWKNIK